MHELNALSEVESPAGASAPSPAAAAVIYRHPLPVRIFHWMNAVCFVILLMSGFQIFNAYPRLHWGHTGYFDTPAVFEITGNQDLGNPRGWIALNGRLLIETGGVFGGPVKLPLIGIQNPAFPGWMTLPTARGDLHNGRGWHFLTLYFFAANLFLYLAYGLVSGRFRTTLIPARDQIRPRSILRDLWMHLRLKSAAGAEAARYNLLQKLSYAVVVFILLPTMVLTGMTMSPSSLARFAWLIDLFNGRQTARTLHFIVAVLLLLFVLVHIFQVFVAGFRNEMRAMISGWFRIPSQKAD